MGHLEAITLTLTACMAFGIVHSLLILEPVKNLAVRIISEQRVKIFYRLAFTLISILTTVATVYLILLIPDVVLFKGPIWWRALMYFGEAAGLVFGALAFRVIDLQEFLGIRQAIRYMKTGDSGGDIEGMTNEDFVAKSVYGIVRHPLYFAGIIIFACQPTVTRNWLVVSVVAITYFIYGSIIEEKRIIARFGEEYRQYMRSVPAFIPRIIPRFKK